MIISFRFYLKLIHLCRFDFFSVSEVAATKRNMGEKMIKSLNRVRRNRFVIYLVMSGLFPYSVFDMSHCLICLFGWVGLLRWTVTSQCRGQVVTGIKRQFLKNMQILDMIHILGVITLPLTLGDELGKIEKGKRILLFSVKCHFLQCSPWWWRGY